MSRKMMFGLLVVVSLLSLALTACDGGDNTCVSGVYDAQGKCMVHENETVTGIKTEVKKAQDDVQTQVQKARDAAQQAVEQGLKDARSEDNPFNEAGKALDEQSCKARGGVWFAGACNK